jgi:hypothetical protein
MADDLKAEQTPGFKVGEKKTIDEYHKLGESAVKTTPSSVSKCARLPGCIIGASARENKDHYRHV